MWWAGRGPFHRRPGPSPDTAAPFSRGTRRRPARRPAPPPHAQTGACNSASPATTQSTVIGRIPRPVVQRKVRSGTPVSPGRIVDQVEADHRDQAHEQEGAGAVAGGPGIDAVPVALRHQPFDERPAEPARQGEGDHRAGHSRRPQVSTMPSSVPNTMPLAIAITSAGSGTKLLQHHRADRAGRRPGPEVADRLLDRGGRHVEPAGRDGVDERTDRPGHRQHGQTEGPDESGRRRAVEPWRRAHSFSIDPQAARRAALPFKAS